MPGLKLIHVCKRGYRVLFYFLILFPMSVIFLYETGPIGWIFSQLCVLMAWLVLKHQGISNNSTEYTPIYSQLFGVNSLRPRQNGCHFADNTFKRIFLKENVRISIKISLKFVPKSPIDNIPALFQIMAWRHPGDKPLSEAMMVSLRMQICIPRPQWVNG